MNHHDMLIGADELAVAACPSCHHPYDPNMIGRGGYQDGTQTWWKGMCPQCRSTVERTRPSWLNGDGDQVFDVANCLETYEETACGKAFRLLRELGHEDLL